MITAPYVWLLATKLLKIILSLSLARNGHREEIPTLDSTTASGGTGLLRMRLSPFCTGKITCKYNTVLICFVPLYLSVTQIPLIWKVVLRPQWLFPYSCSLAEVPSNTNMSGICICSHSSSKLTAYRNVREKNAILSLQFLKSQHTVCASYYFFFFSSAGVGLCWLLLCWWCPTAPRALKAEWWFFSWAVELIIHS